MAFSEEIVKKRVFLDPTTNTYTYRGGSPVASSALLTDWQGVAVDTSQVTAVYALTSPDPIFETDGQIKPNISTYFYPGDEVAVWRTNSSGNATYEDRLWVLDDQQAADLSGTVSYSPTSHLYLPNQNLSDSRFYSAASITNHKPKFLIKADGALWTPAPGVAYTMKIIRSGRRNHLGASVGGFAGKMFSNTNNTLWTDPLPSEDLLSVGAATFTERGKIYREQAPTDLTTPVNPFLEGLRGVWRADRSYAYQAPRNYSSGSLKEDAYFDYAPFWMFSNNHFEPNPSLSTDWLETGKVTAYSAYGASAESEDILGNRVASLPALFHTTNKAAANNARLNEIAFESFEDLNMVLGTPIPRFEDNHNHFGFYQRIAADATLLTDQEAHTGRYAMQLNAQTEESFEKTSYLPGAGAQTDGVPFLIDDADLMPYFGFSPVATDKEFGFVVSYWRKLGSNPGDVPDYDALVLNVEVQEDDGSGFSTIGSMTQDVQTSNIIDGWQKVDVITRFTGNGHPQRVVFTFDNNSTLTGYFDDFRVHPINANMVGMVYDNATNRLVAELDENNFATLYDFDESGAVVRVKRETHRGRFTLQETRNSTVKTQP